MLSQRNHMRISGLPTFLACPSSALPTEHPYEPQSDVADLGRAVHLALAGHVMEQPVDLNEIAASYGVSVDELEQLYRYGCQAWTQLHSHFPHPIVEAEVEGPGIKGHVDVLQIGDDGIKVVDWKSNRVKREYDAQLSGYAAAAVNKYGVPEDGKVTVITVWLRFGETDIRTVTSDDVERLYTNIEEAEAGVGKKYGPGDPCTVCCRQLVCDARREYLSAAAGALLPLAAVEINAELLPRLYGKAKMLKKALAQYDQALKIHLREHGPQDAGEGLVLELTQTSRDKIIPLAAWPHLAAIGFSDEKLSHCISMSKTKIMETVSADNSRGNKTKAKAALLKTLREEGALLTTVSDSILARKGTP